MINFIFREAEIDNPFIAEAFREIARLFAGIKDNIFGSVTFATSGTAAVVFDSPVTIANYKIFVIGNVNETFWVTSKTVTGFTVNSSNGSSVAVVDWLLIE